MREWINQLVQFVKNGGFSELQSIIIALIAVLLFSGIMLLFKKRILSKCDMKKVDLIDRSLTDYFKEAICRNFWAFLLVILIPLVVSLILNNGIILLLSVWGLAITMLSAYYASKAHNSAMAAFEEACHTRQEVINFAKDLEGFIYKVLHRLNDYSEDRKKIRIKLLAAIPAFGSVGCYRIGFPDKLKQLVLNNQWELEFLFHNEKQIYNWLVNIISAVEKDPVLAEKEVEMQYKRQIKFVGELINGLPPRTRTLKLWDVNNLIEVSDKLRESAKGFPFQFLLIETLDTGEMELFFLFSGDSIYNFIFRLLPEQEMKTYVK